jgi:hypothetical protein
MSIFIKQTVICYLKKNQWQFVNTLQIFAACSYIWELVLCVRETDRDKDMAKEIERDTDRDTKMDRETERNRETDIKTDRTTNRTTNRDKDTDGVRNMSI